MIAKKIEVFEKIKKIGGGGSGRVGWGGDGRGQGVGLGGQGGCERNVRGWVWLGMADVKQE